MSQPDGRVPRSYVTQPPAVSARDDPPVRAQTPREARLALYRSQTVDGALASADPRRGPGRVLVAAAALAGVPASIIFGAALSTLLTVVTLPIGLPTWWRRGTWNLLETAVGLFPWLMLACVLSSALLVVHMLRGRPRDPLGRPVPRSRPTTALAAATLGLIVLTPTLAVSGFFFFFVAAYSCGTSSATCW